LDEKALGEEKVDLDEMPLTPLEQRVDGGTSRAAPPPPPPIRSVTCDVDTSAAAAPAPCEGSSPSQLRLRLPSFGTACLLFWCRRQHMYPRQQPRRRMPRPALSVEVRMGSSERSDRSAVRRPRGGSVGGGGKGCGGTNGGGGAGGVGGEVGGSGGDGGGEGGGTQ